MFQNKLELTHKTFFYKPHVNKYMYYREDYIKNINYLVQDLKSYQGLVYNGVLVHLVLSS